MAKSKSLGFLGAAERVLAEAGEPLHYGEITRRALANEWQRQLLDERLEASADEEGETWEEVRAEIWPEHR